MIQIRQDVFETNSSSTHSITMVSGDMFDKWKNGEVYFSDGWMTDGKTWITQDELVALADDKDYFKGLLQKENYNSLADEYDIYTYNSFFNWLNFETYKDDYFTEKGEHVVAFGYYGNDW